MTVGDFRSPDSNSKGWLEIVKQNRQVKINYPVNKQTFLTNFGESKKEITVSGAVKGKKGKILVVIRTDRDYPQA